jgi:putative tricarboxylic transport membrane protein
MLRDVGMVRGVSMVRSSEFWGGLFWLAIGTFIIWSGRDLGLGRLNEPGPGFILFWIGCLMVALAGVVLLAAFREPGSDLAHLWTGTRWGKVAFVVTLLLAYGAAFEPIGFVPCTLALLLILMLFVDPVPWWQALLVAFGAVFTVWYVITRTLKIQLPAGVLAPWLG